MESLTPLFKCLTDGVHRLECQEAEEEAAAEEQAKISGADGESDVISVEPARTKTEDDQQHPPARTDDDNGNTPQKTP